jgi:hypothetical protein
MTVISITISLLSLSFKVSFAEPSFLGDKYIVLVSIVASTISLLSDTIVYSPFPLIMGHAEFLWSYA